MSKKYLAEIVGTMLLVLGGCGSAVLAGHEIGFLGVAFSFGLTLLFLIYTVGPISGCHLNPAVTLCLTLSNKFPKNDALGYIVSQLVGAALGGGILYLIATGKTGFDISKGFALNGYGEHSPQGYSLLACAITETVLTQANKHSPQGYSLLACAITETVLTSVLLYAILASTKPYYQGGFAGVAIGLCLTVIHLISIPVTNTSVNFARSFGVAIYHGGWALQELWLFLVTSILGAVLARTIFCLTHPEKI